LQYQKTRALPWHLQKPQWQSENVNHCIERNQNVQQWEA